MHIKRLPGSSRSAPDTHRDRRSKPPSASSASHVPSRPAHAPARIEPPILQVNRCDIGSAVEANLPYFGAEPPPVTAASFTRAQAPVPSASTLLSGAQMHSYPIDHLSETSSDDDGSGRRPQAPLAAAMSSQPLLSGVPLGVLAQPPAITSKGSGPSETALSARQPVPHPTNPGGALPNAPGPNEALVRGRSLLPTKVRRRTPRMVRSQATSQPRPTPSSAASASTVSPLISTLNPQLHPGSRSGPSSEPSGPARASTGSRSAPLMGQRLTQGVQSILGGLTARKGILVLGLFLASCATLPALQSRMSSWRDPRAGWTASGATSGAGGGVETSPGSPGSGPGGWAPSAQVRVVTVVPKGVDSPYRTTWDELAQHSAQRLEWTDPSYQMQVFYDSDLGADSAGTGERRRFLDALSTGPQVLVGFNILDTAAASFLSSSAAQLPDTRLFLENDQSSVGADAGVPLSTATAAATLQGLSSLAGWSPGLAGMNPLSDFLVKKVSWSSEAKASSLFSTIKELLSRRNSDDFLFVFLVLINQYVTTVPSVAMTTKGIDLKSLYCMVTKCGPKIMNCVNDPVCKAGLDCLQACSFNDQVCQYRCIVSHETPKFADFSLCILQLNNCRGLDAQPPLMPNPAPMSTFQGKPMTHEIAEDMFVGWMAPGLGSKPVSWMVAAGKNPAYDYFPCQHQIFYRGRGKGVMWYEPIFKAIKLDGEAVWRHRRYRVRRAETPGTVHMSVLDNGVTSNEFWRIVDCEENYAWCLFYYSGAASTAGLSYSGAVLATPDGDMPAPQFNDRLNAALENCGIKEWELSYVDNSACQGAPLNMASV